MLIPNVTLALGGLDFNGGDVVKNALIGLAKAGCCGRCIVSNEFKEGKIKTMSKIYLSPSNKTATPMQRAVQMKWLSATKLPPPQPKHSSAAALRLWLPKSGTLLQTRAVSPTSLEQTFICQSTLMRLTAEYTGGTRGAAIDC